MRIRPFSFVQKKESHNIDCSMNALIASVCPPSILSDPARTADTYDLLRDPVTQDPSIQDRNEERSLCDVVALLRLSSWPERVKSSWGEVSRLNCGLDAPIFA